MNSKSKFKQSLVLIILSIFMFLYCAPLNPVNDFFGIQMNPDEEANFVIVNYTDVDGVTYKNSMNMNPQINAWAEVSTNEVIIKITNESEEDLPLNYTGDQFIVITDDKGYYLGKGEREEYFKIGRIPSKESVSFVLELPVEHHNISRTHTGFVEGPQKTKNVMRNFTKAEGRIAVPKDDIEFILCRLGDTSIVLKRVPNTK